MYLKRKKKTCNLIKLYAFSVLNYLLYGGGEMTQSIKSLPPELEDLSLEPRTHKQSCA